MNTINARIEELRANDPKITITKIRAYLTIDGYSAKNINSAIKEADGLSKSKKGFANDYYEWLAVKPRKDWEAEDYIEGDGEYGETTPNIKKHKSHYLNIYNLSKTIWDAKVEVEEEVENPDWPEDETGFEESEHERKVREAWEKLDKAIKKGKKNKSIHPDKVSGLGDVELTDAYTEFFKEYNK